MDKKFSSISITVPHFCCPEAGIIIDISRDEDKVTLDFYNKVKENGEGYDAYKLTYSKPINDCPFCGASFA
jgi:hypothetical protein